MDGPEAAGPIRLTLRFGPSTLVLAKIERPTTQEAKIERPTTQECGICNLFDDDEASKNMETP